MVPKEAPLIVLDSKSTMCMAKNGMDTKHTSHIARRIHFVRNGEKCKMHKIDWWKGGLQLADIGTNNVSEPVNTNNEIYYGKTWELKIDHLYKRGDRVQDSYEEQEFWMTRLDWVGIQLNQFEKFE